MLGEIRQHTQDGRQQSSNLLVQDVLQDMNHPVRDEEDAIGYNGIQCCCDDDRMANF